MVAKMNVYHKLAFSSREEAGRASDALMKWATTRDGVMQSTQAAAFDRQRIVMWEETDGMLDTGTLYVSEGALNVLKRVHSSVPTSEMVAAADLPDDRRLMIGLESDWQNK